MTIRLDFFSRTYAEKEDAQYWACPDGVTWFSTKGVFMTPNGAYVYADLRLQEWTKSEATKIALEVHKLTGHLLVSWTNPLFGWMDWELDEPDPMSLVYR